MGLITLLIVGLVAGVVARLVFPGSHPMGLLRTIALGVAGSFVGGTISALLRSDGPLFAFSPSGLIWSTIGALVVLAVVSIAGRGARA